MPQSYAKLNFQPEILEAKHLPLIPYPIPVAALKRVLASGGMVETGDLLYWIMDYLDQPDAEGRLDYERALLQIAEDRVPAGEGKAVRLQVSAPSRRSFWCASVDVSKPLVSFEQQGRLLAIAQASDEPTRMKVAVYGAVTGALAMSVVSYAREQDMAGPWDSFAALLHKAGSGWSNFYAQEAGRLYTVPWHYGLGWNSPDIFDETYRDKLQLNPISPALSVALFKLWAEKNLASQKAVSADADSSKD